MTSIMHHPAQRRAGAEQFPPVTAVDDDGRQFAGIVAAV
jgi:hypothetical protein